MLSNNRGKQKLSRTETNQLSPQDSAEIAVVGCEDGRVYLWNVKNEDTIEICKHGDSIVYLSAILCDGMCYTLFIYLWYVL